MCGAGRAASVLEHVESISPRCVEAVVVDAVLTCVIQSGPYRVASISPPKVVAGVARLVSTTRVPVVALSHGLATTVEFRLFAFRLALPPLCVVDGAQRHAVFRELRVLLGVAHRARDAGASQLLRRPRGSSYTHMSICRGVTMTS